MKTGLFSKHQSLGAKIVDFAGWEMPILYKGIITEHMAVRERVGIFDVSHMGRIEIKGEGTEIFLDYLSTNCMKGRGDQTATYTVWCDENGGAVDDLIVYKENENSFFVIVNASNREKDLAHLKKHLSLWRQLEGISDNISDMGNNISIEPKYDDGILALQGPKAKNLMEELFMEELFKGASDFKDLKDWNDLKDWKAIKQMKPMELTRIMFDGESVIIATTGYTGSGGYEIFSTMATTIKLWDLMLKVGEKYGLEPIGLGARDTLRLEMGYALYGHELSDEITPIESVSSWTVHLEDRNFFGAEALRKLIVSSRRRYAYGVVLVDKGIAREGYEVFLCKENDSENSSDTEHIKDSENNCDTENNYDSKNKIENVKEKGNSIGYVTSGTMSPTLNQSIALILVDQKLKDGQNVEIQVRQKRCRAKVTKLPFYGAKKPVTLMADTTADTTADTNG